MKDDYDRWARFFSGNLSEEENEDIQRWIDASIDHREYATEMRELWDNLSARKPVALPQSVDDSWSAVIERAKVEHGRSRRAKEREPVRRPKRYPVFRMGILVSVLIVPILFFLYSRTGTLDQNQQLITYKSEKGERLSIRLNDGSMAYLSVDSKLIVPEKFTVASREVELEGEGYFDVVSDETRPFVVHAGPSSVEVLGTEFNLRSYESEEEVTLLVTEGRVSFHNENVRSSDGSLVVAGHRGTYSEGQPILVEDYERIDAVLGWREGKLIFEDRSLAEITSEIERWYTTEFRFDEASLSEIKITVTVDLKGNEPLGNVLDVIEQTAGVKCTRGELVVVISR